MEQFERLNTLSEKSINDTATVNELKEFSNLLIAWNQSTEYNLLHATYTFITNA